MRKETPMSTSKALPADNKMGTMGVNKLLITMALPMIISMLIQALYNIVDSYFVNLLSQEAFDAVSLAFPIQHLIIGVATGTAVGVNSLLSRSLGEGNREKANRIAEHGVFLAFLSWAAFFIFGIFGTRFFYGFFAKDISPLTVEYGVEYLTICCCCSFGVFGQITFERLMQATGRTFYTMITQGLGAIVNIIMDPILIFGKFGFPEMGVSGAAVATVIGQCFAFLLAYLFNKTKNADLNLSVRKFRPDRKIIGSIYSIGVPSILMMAIGSVMTTGMNKILGGFGTQTTITVYGIYFKIQSFIFMPVLGLNNGLIPIVAYNYGAKSKGRLTKAIKLALIYGFAIMFLGMLLLQFFPHQLLGLFETDKTSADFFTLGVPAFRTISLSFTVASFCIVLSAVFQAFGKGVLSMIVSFARQLVVLLPAAYLLSLTGNIEAVWWSFPIAEIASLIVSVISFVSLWKKTIRHIPE